MSDVLLSRHKFGIFFVLSLSLFYNNFVFVELFPLKLVRNVFSNFNRFGVYVTVYSRKREVFQLSNGVPREFSFAHVNIRLSFSVSQAEKQDVLFVAKNFWVF